MALDFEKAFTVLNALEISFGGLKKGALITNDGDPNGTVTGTVGALCIDYSGTGKLWKNTTGSTTWTDISSGGGGSGFTTTSVKTANYTVAANEIVPIDSTGSSFTLTLPASPSHGDRFLIPDVGGSLNTNPVTLARNGNTINGIASDVSLDLNNSLTEGIYITSYGWRVF